MTQRQRDLYSIFSKEKLLNDDLYRLYYWTRGMRAGYEGNGLIEVPTVYLSEFEDGARFGNEMYSVRHK